MRYPEDFQNRVKEIFMDANIPEGREVLQALEGNSVRLGQLLENLCQLHFSPHQIQQLFSQKREQEVLVAANLAVACVPLFGEWDKIYKAQQANTLGHLSVNQVGR